MNGTDVDQAFAFVERTYSGTPCRECKGRETAGMVFEGMVIASCEECGGATRFGRLAKLWNPATQRDHQRPILRAPQATALNGHAVRRRVL